MQRFGCVWRPRDDMNESFDVTLAAWATQYRCRMPSVALSFLLVHQNRKFHPIFPTVDEHNFLCLLLLPKLSRFAYRHRTLSTYLNGDPSGVATPKPFSPIFCPTFIVLHGSCSLV